MGKLGVIRRCSARRGKYHGDVTFPNAQSQYQVRSEWGVAGARSVATDADVVVWVDVLGAEEQPARRQCAHAVAEFSALGARAVAGSLRNRTAVARWVSQQQNLKGGRVRVAVIAAGDVHEDGSILFSVEDLLATGAVIDAFAAEGTTTARRKPRQRVPRSPGCAVPSGIWLLPRRLAGARLRHSTIYPAFHQLLAQTGLEHDYSPCPRLHDFRHSFAVKTLLGWYGEGVDVAAHMPLLSTYLGHVNPASTYWYLSAAPELLALAAKYLEDTELEDDEGEQS